MTDQGQIKNKLEQLLCPPGNGVYTIHTAKENKDKLHTLLFGSIDNVEENWKKSLEHLSSSDVLLLGVCSDTGGGILRGANWGPLFLRETLLNLPDKLKYMDLGDVRVVPHLLHDKYLNLETIKNVRRALYGNEDSTYPVSALSITEDVCDLIYKNFSDKKIFGVGGDHSCSYPLVKSYLKSKKEKGKKTALIHFDAHTDLLVERLGIDICFGSWTTHVLKYLPDPSLCFQIGIRATGKSKEHWESTFGVKQFWANYIKEVGPAHIAEQILAKLKDQKVDELYVSFDIDTLDAQYASSTGTPETGGLSPHECTTIIEMLAKEFPITGADIMEIAPFIGDGREVTLMSAGSIATSLINSLGDMP